MKNLIRSALLLTLCFSANAAESTLLERINQLEARVSQLEQQLAEKSSSDRWKEPVYWKRLKKEMPMREVELILGKPKRTEEQIFTTWYYHHSSKLHSYIWFDEGKVLNWELPDHF